MAEEPSSAEPTEADEAEAPAPAEEPMETVTVSLTKKKGEIFKKNYCIAQLVRDEKENSDWFPQRPRFCNTGRRDELLTKYFRRIALSSLFNSLHKINSFLKNRNLLFLQYGPRTSSITYLYSSIKTLKEMFKG